MKEQLREPGAVPGALPPLRGALELAREIGDLKAQRALLRLKARALRKCGERAGRAAGPFPSQHPPPSGTRVGSRARLLTSTDCRAAGPCMGPAKAKLKLGLLHEDIGA